MSQYDAFIQNLRDWARSSPEGQLEGYAGGAAPYSDADIAAQEANVNAVDLNAPEGLAGVSGPGGAQEPFIPEPQYQAIAPMPLPVPSGGAPLPPAKKLATSSRARKNATKGSAPAVTAEVETQAALAPATAPDALTGGLKDKENGLLKERQDALAKALSAKDLSTEEKVAMALIGILPGILGGIGGGVLGGAAGAATGVAGGLHGSAQGIQMIADSKTAAHKEALDQAKELAGRIDQVGAQQLEHQGVLDQRAFSHGENEANRAQSAKLAADQLASHERTTRMNINAEQARTNALLGAKAAAAGGKPVKQADKDFYTNIDTAFNKINELENVVQKHGNWESALGDPAAAATLNQAPYELAIAYAKLVDPTSVAREGEVEAAKKYMIQLGLTTPNRVTLEALKNLRQSLLQKASSRADLGTPLPNSVYAAEQQGAPKASNHQKYGF